MTTCVCKRDVYFNVGMAAIAPPSRYGSQQC